MAACIGFSTPEGPDAVISGELSGSVTEDVAVDANGDLVASGQLAITDPDAGEAFFNVGDGDGRAHSLTITPDGAWTYEVDNDLPAVQSLGTGDTLTDTVTVTSVDGTTQDIAIHGSVVVFRYGYGWSTRGLFQRYRWRFVGGSVLQHLLTVHSGDEGYGTEAAQLPDPIMMRKV